MNLLALALPRAWRHLAVLAALLVALLPAAANADPPGRAARLSYASGDASFAPAGSDDWVVARINRPLWIGDRLWSANGYAELQIGGASLRLAPRTTLTVLNFDDRLAQFEVTGGSAALHVRAIDTSDQAIEIDTPSLAFVVRTEGDYRVDVDRDRTAVGVRRGWAEVWGAERAFRIDRREQFVFYDADLRDYDVYAVPAADAFERWARERARREDRAESARHVPPELVGFVDLDDHGEWRAEPSLGSVWYPRVDAAWAPYRHGHWTWIDPWGWTWIDDAQWGFAPFHYGRWTQVRGRWGWVPGPRDVRPVYAPALVAWVGGADDSFTIASGRSRGVAWFPLAPGEVWRPAYDVSRDYFTRANVTNTVVNQTTVINVYDDMRARGPVRDEYRYRGVSSAVTVVPVETFVESRPVHRHALRVDARAVARAPVAAAPDVRPVLQSFVGAAARTQARPPAEAVRRSVIAREVPPAAVPSLQDKLNLVRERGQPIDRGTLERVQPSPQPPAAGGSGEKGPRAAPQDLRSGVRVVGNRDAQPVAIAPRPPAGVAQTPRGPVVDAPRAAAQPGDADRERDAAASRRGRDARTAAPERDAEAPRMVPEGRERPPGQPVAPRGKQERAGRSLPPGAEARDAAPERANEAQRKAPAQGEPVSGQPGPPRATQDPPAGTGRPAAEVRGAAPERGSHAQRTAPVESEPSGRRPSPSGDVRDASRPVRSGTAGRPSAPERGETERPAPAERARSAEPPARPGDVPDASQRTMRPGPAPDAPARPPADRSDAAESAPAPGAPAAARPTPSERRVPDAAIDAPGRPAGAAPQGERRGDARHAERGARGPAGPAPADNRKNAKDRDEDDERPRGTGER